MKGYTTRGQIENYLLITIDPSFYNQVDSWIEQIEKYIDQATGRSFVADTTATERLYDGDSSSILLIDDAVEVTKLTIDGTELDESGDAEYLLYPANKLPKTKIKYDGQFSRGDQNIAVEAKWGYSVTAPADITMIATVIVAGIINFSMDSEGEVKSMSIGRYSVTYKDKTEWSDFDRVNEILKSYKKYNLV